MANTASAIIAEAKKWIGYHEDGNNHTIFGAWYGLDGEAWCDMFVSYIAAQTGNADVVGRFAYCPSHVAWFKNRGQWGATPKPGAIVFFTWDGGPVADHVGIVTAVNGDGSITTVEGNADNQVEYLTRRGSILGYGYPAYAAESGSNGGTVAKVVTVVAGMTLAGIAGSWGLSANTVAKYNHIPDPNKIYPGQVITSPPSGWTPPTPTPPVTTPPVTKPPVTPPPPNSSSCPTFPGAAQFGPGKVSGYVTTLGRLLVANGENRFYKVGPGPEWTWSADGTATADFQRRQGWTGSGADGIPGPMTWAALCKAQPASTANPWPGSSAVAYGSHSDTVKALQGRLIAHGFLASNLATGYYGPLTRAAVTRAQSALGFHGADADGIVGPQTWASLFNH